MAQGIRPLHLVMLGVVPLTTASALVYLQHIGILRLPVWGQQLAVGFLLLFGAVSALTLAARQERDRRHLQGQSIQCPSGADSELCKPIDEASPDRFSELVDEIQHKALDVCCAQLAAAGNLPDTEIEVERQATNGTPSPAAREESVRLSLKSVPEAIYGVDSAGVCTFCNRACVDLLGYRDKSQLVGKPIQDLMPLPVQRTQTAAHEGKPIHAEETFWRADGTLFPVEYWSFPLTKGSQVVGAVVTFVDITERKRSEVALFREKERAQVTLSCIADGVITTDAAGAVRYLNPAAEGLLGWQNSDAVGKPFARVFEVLNPVDQSPVQDLLASNKPGCRKSEGHVSSLLVTRDRSRLFVEQSVAAIRDRDGAVIGHIIVFRDVSESRRLARQLAYQASHDPLTGAINRREFEIRIERVLEATVDKRTDCAVCFLDLDQFKVVNDTCGHRAGDELLRQLTRLLRGHLRQRDTLARLGGDEFGLLLEGCSLEDAHRITDAIREAIHEFRFGWEEKTFTLGVSIGLVEIDAGLAYTLVEVLTAADAACYLAKDKGRNRVEVHQPTDDKIRQMRGEAHWVCKIQRALEEDRFKLYFQDIVDVHGGPPDSRADHIEILVRMLDHNGNLAMPGAFLPAAERYNVIQATDRWVVRKVFEWLTTRAPDSGPSVVSINLSGPTISDGTFLEFVSRTRAETGVDPERICFEITEVSAIAKFTQAITLADKLCEQGFQFALDDFGSGLSSFGYLRQLPVEFVKIDGTFIKDIVDDPVSRAMVRSINDIGHIMGKQTIAECVENRDMLRILREIGVDFVQGYGIRAPQSLETFDSDSYRVVSNA